jgi:multidrug efflux pump subunit AcrA (membrane-fusion protein)
MRFLIRGLSGIGLFLCAALLAAVGAARFAATLQADPADEARAAAERSFAVPVAVLERETLTPRIETYGVVRSWRTLELRAPVPGRIVEIAPRFRDGAEAREGDLLVRIDPADYEAAVADAEAAVEEAQADAREARQAVISAQIELSAAETQRDLRAATLDRQRGLAERGVASTVAVDEAELALAAAEQSVASRGQAVVTAELRVDRADLSVRRAGLSLEEAARALGDTRIVAPFDGLLTDVTATLGEIAAVNEPLGALIDPAALEVAFRVTDAEFSRLLGDDGALRPLPVTVRLPLGEGAVEATAVLDRAGAVIGEGRTGRELFARLNAADRLWLRPDAFVSVSLREPPLHDVAAIPAAASTGDGRILLLEDGRLREVSVAILRRSGDSLIVGDAPFGATYVTARSPQLGPGLKARPLGAAAGGNIRGSGGETVALDPKRRSALIAHVRADPALTGARRAELLEMLNRPEPPRALVERLEAGMEQG